MLRKRIICIMLMLGLLMVGCSHVEDPQKTTAPNADVMVDLTVDTKIVNDAVSPLIYGQFVEHFPGAIYDSIWSEKLLDRKFYYQAGLEGLSPWKVTGEIETRVNEGLNPEDNCVILHNGSIGQELELRDVAYSGYVYAAGSGTLTVAVTGEGTNYSQTINVSAEELTKYAFAFTSGTCGKLNIAFSSADGLTLDSVSLMPADNYYGMDKAVLDTLKELGGTVYRIPGGNFVSGYNWKDGIGPIDSRPCKRNLAWFEDTGNIQDDMDRLAARGDFYSCIEPNDMGIDAYMKMFEYIGAEPYVAVNSGLGTAEDAADLVEYLNGTVDTEYGAYRASNGTAAPYGVTYFAVGNEMQGDWQLGHIPLALYTQRHNEFAQAMRAVDPTIILTGCGDNVSNWSAVMLENCGENIDLIEEHLYASKYDDINKHITFMINNFDMRIRAHRKILEENPAVADVKICFGEYAYGGHGLSTCADMLGIAEVLNMFIENSDVVGMANYTQAVFNFSNNYPAAINVSNGVAVFQSVGYLLKNYAKYFEEYPIALYLRQDRELKLDVQGAISEDGKRMTISIVNPSEKTVGFNHNIQGTVTTQIEIYGDSYGAYNTIQEQHVFENVVENPAAVVVKPRSVTILVVELG